MPLQPAASPYNASPDRSTAPSWGLLGLAGLLDVNRGPIKRGIWL